jgi:carboxymethylenebutenolidase
MTESTKQHVFDLYDDYCHGRIDRRGFFSRAAALTVGGLSALAFAESLLPNYAAAETVSPSDKRIQASYVDYDSPGGTSGSMRGYFVRPAG